MSWRQKTKWYYCKHCGNKFTLPFMASICFDLDMKILADTKIPDKEKKDILVKKA
jgi:hypothetical protein